MATNLYEIALRMAKDTIVEPWTAPRRNVTISLVDTRVRKLVQVRSLCRTGEARRIRQASQLSLADVSERPDVPAPTIHRWETGQRRPTGDGAIRYGALLDELRRSK